MLTGSEFPVPGEPGTGKNWRHRQWGLWLPPTPAGYKSETQEPRKLSWNKSTQVATWRPRGMRSRG